MSYAISTRGGGPVPFARAIFEGLAPDGGLYLPREVGRLATPPRADAPFPSTALAMAEALLGGEVGARRLAAIVDDALDFPAPVVRLDEGLYLLELFRGPTLAFKDVGARFLARAMATLDEDGRARTVLVATSGDTGGAVADAFHGVDPFRVVALFPRDGISGRQRRQMTTLGGNVTAVSVDGTFDDCQRLTKEAFGDAELREARGLTSANSINLGRLLPQTFYYAHAAAALGWDAPPPTWVVPSGNLGNLCAGVLARRAGVPGRRLIAALNRNRTFLDFLETGAYDPRPSAATPSSAMDVGAPSNLERLRRLYPDAAALRREIEAHTVDDATTLRTVARAREGYGRLVDPHTAVGLAAWEAAGRPRPAVVLATAHPAKFPEAMRQAVGEVPPVPRRLAERLDAPEAVREIPATLDALRGLLEEA